MGKFSQDKFAAALTTPLGKDFLCLETFSASEGLSEPFEIQVDCLSEKENINFDDALGQACTIKLKTYEQKERFFCGILTHAQWLGSTVGDQKESQYRLVLRPWFWLLNHRANCRIFLDKTVKEIIEQVFTDAEFSSGTDFKFRTTGSYDKIKYCVQYRESDFAFVSRLMEQYGIYYYFEHKDNQHTMVLADSRGSHDKINDLPNVNYHGQVMGYKRVEQQIDSWVADRRFSTGKFEFNDYDYLKPPKKLRAHKETSEDYKRSRWEVYDYPGKYDEQNKGEHFAQFRLEAEQALDRRRNAGGEAPSLFAGGLVTLENHPTSDENKEYLVVHASHHFGVQSYGPSADGASYQGSYQFLRSDRPFRSLPVTPKPRIQGIQTAKVVTKKGEDHEEISTDEHGHIWVQFYWDREPKKSCPIRVAQPWAGKGWGHQFIPRVGMEVVVEFLEGDPDRPLVTGCVYNGDNETAFELPRHKNVSGLVTDSSKGHHGKNEFIFDDTKGDETIRLYAEKDYQLEVRDTEKRVIGKDRVAVLKKGNDQLVIKNGAYEADVNGTHFTHAKDRITVTSNKEVSHSTNYGAGSFQTLTTTKITIMAPGQIEIFAPLVTITGNVVVTGGMMVGGRPV